MKYLYFTSIFLFLFSCSDNVNQENQSNSKKEKSVILTKKQLEELKIVLDSPEIRSIGLSIHANGKIEVPPMNKTFITVPFGGFVKSIRVLDGDVVKKGEELLTIEHPELIQLQQEYLELQANMDYLKSEVERMDILVKNEAGSLKNLQSAKSNYNVAKAKLSGLKVKLEMADVNMKKLNNGEIQRRISIVAPFDGVVTKILSNVGEFASETSNLMEIIDLKHAHAEVFVFEKDVKFIQVGQKVTLTTVDDTKEIAATVYLVGKEVGKDRTIKVHCHLEKESENFVPGTFFKATILTNPTNLTTLDSESFVKIQNKDAVFINTNVKGDKFEFIPYFVRILKQNDGKTAFEYLNQKPKESAKIVSKETFEVLSTYLKTISNEEE
jgi:cobalt-zinc-cadmium efflux system membrane fusion protein